MLYLHVGLPKTGTTFMQNAVFPKWEGVTYSSRANIEYVAGIDLSKPNLVSNESLISDPNYLTQDRRLEAMKRLSGLFPNARLLMSFRKHSSYIVSCYRQYLQKGGTISFDQYFDIEHDRGWIQQSEFEFRTEIESVTTVFGNDPFVFTQEEIRKDLPSLLSSIEGFIGGRAPDLDEIEMIAYNRSVGYHQAKLLRFANRFSRSQFNPGGRWRLYSRTMQRMRLDPRSICQYRLDFLPDRPFVSADIQSRIDNRYQEDWGYVQDCVRRRQRATCESVAG